MTDKKELAVTEGIQGHRVVKIIRNDDGEKYDHPKWHLVSWFGDSPRTACSGEVFGYGEGSAEYKEKIVARRGGITCPHCIEVIKWYKSIKL